MFKKRPLEPGVVYTNERFAKLDLADVDLSGSSLTDCSFYKSDLSRANFAGANLKKCSFEQADLTGANFTGAVLNGAVFQGAKVIQVNFTDADLTSAYFSAAEPEYTDKYMRVADQGDPIRTSIRKTSFINANLKGATFFMALIEDVDFSSTKNLTFGSLRDARLKRVTGAPSRPSETPSAKPKVPVTGGHLRTQLSEIEKLLNDGLIDSSEYESLRKKILGI